MLHGPILGCLFCTDSKSKKSILRSFLRSELFHLKMLHLLFEVMVLNKSKLICITIINGYKFQLFKPKVFLGSTIALDAKVRAFAQRFRHFANKTFHQVRVYYRRIRS